MPPFLVLTAEDHFTIRIDADTGYLVIVETHFHVVVFQHLERSFPSRLHSIAIPMARTGIAQ
jgi:hypothetical protein